MTTTDEGPRLRVILPDGDPAVAPWGSPDGEQPAGQPAAAGDGRVVAGEAWDVDAGDGGALPPPELQPVIPRVLRDAEQRAALARYLRAHAAHAVAFHTVRLPHYAVRTVMRAPVGAARVVADLGSFLSDGEGRPLRQDAVMGRDPKTYLHLVRERNARIRRRWQAAIGLGVFGALAVVAALFLVPGWVAWVGVATGLVVLARVGSVPGQPLVESSVTTFDVPKLTHPIIEAALGALGIGELNRAIRIGQGPSFPSDVARDGAGWRAEVDLPLGVTVGDILDKRDRLASALRRPLGTVWPEGDPDVHEGRLVLWVGDRDLSKAGRIAWRLEKAGTHDVFKPFQLGKDPRGRVVEAPLIFENWLIGSMPRQGKTATVRLIACAGALDPTVELWLHELKGTGDLDGLEQVSHRYRSGVDDESIAYTAESLAMLKDEVRARGERLKRLPSDMVPDKKVTRAIASRRKFGLHPIVCVIDECQNLFADKTHGKQAGEDAEYIIKIGPALGIVLVLATQRPDKDSLPTGVSGNVSQRFCLHVAGQVENDMILGTSAYKNGYRATMFRPGVEAGIGIQKGARNAPLVLRTAYLDGPQTAAIGRRARAAREAAGLLTGHAIGQDHAREPGTVVNVAMDVLSVFEPGEVAAWNETLIARLTDLRPGHYDGWTSAQLTAALKARGVDVVRDVHRDKQTRRGIRADHLRTALQEDQPC